MTVYLLKAEPYDPASVSTVEVRFSVGSDRPKFDGKHWPARMIAPPEIEASLFLGDPFGGDAPSLNFSPVRISVGDGDNDAIRTYNWEGARVFVYKGEEGDSFSSFSTIINSVVRNISWTRDEFVVNIESGLALADVPLQGTNFFSGTGGTEGDAGLAGKPKPILYGSGVRIPPTILSRRNSIYQINEGAISAVDAVYRAGSSLNDAGDFADITKIAKTLYETDSIVRVKSFGDGGSYAYTANPVTVGAESDQYSLSVPYDARSGFRLSNSSGETINESWNQLAFLDNGGKVLVAREVVTGSTFISQVDLSASWILPASGFTATLIDLESNGHFLSPEVAGVAVDISLDDAFSNDSTINTSVMVLCLDAVSGGDVIIAEYRGGDFSSGDFVLVASGSSSTFRMIWKPDGTKFIVAENDGTTIELQLWELTAAWDILTASPVSGENFTAFQSSKIGAFASNEFDMALADDGNILFWIDVSAEVDGKSYLISLPTAWSLAGVNGRIGPDDYATQISGGYVIANTPSTQGVVTVDATGKKDAAALIYAGEICLAMLNRNIDSGLISSSTFTNFDATTPVEVVHFTPESKKPSLLSAARQVASSAGATILPIDLSTTPPTYGQLSFARIDFSSPAGAFSDADVFGLRRIPPARPVFSIDVDYARRWRVLNESEIDSRASDDNAEFAVRESSTSRRESSLVQDQFARARSVTYRTTITNQPDADAERDRRFELLSVRRDEYQFSLKGRQFEFAPGQTIALDHPDTRVLGGVVTDNSGSTITANDGSAVQSNRAIKLLIRSVRERRGGITEIAAWG